MRTRCTRVMVLVVNLLGLAPWVAAGEPGQAGERSR